MNGTNCAVMITPQMVTVIENDWEHFGRKTLDSIFRQVWLELRKEFTDKTFRNGFILTFIARDVTDKEKV